ncbi:MAG: class I SAM-dependent methyltransferase [Defluviicoccus sp.]|nr:MAG: class I SAM-dependent methyltransferase [Defluviicoccus sp.]
MRALWEWAVAGGLGTRVHPVVADMAEPPFAPQSFDLLWCESAIYAVGCVSALSGWRRLLRTGGSLAFSELVWLTDEQTVEAAAFWAENYPQMTDLAGVRADLAVSGYRLVAEFVVPQEDWTDGYYRPLATNFASFKRRHAADLLAMRTLSDQRREMALVERHHGAFAYAFSLLFPLIKEGC